MSLRDRKNSLICLIALSVMPQLVFPLAVYAQVQKRPTDPGASLVESVSAGIEADNGSKEAGIAGDAVLAVDVKDSWPNDHEPAITLPGGHGSELALLGGGTGGAIGSGTSRGSDTPVLQGSCLQVEELDRQIVLNEILLEKHAINFRRYNNVQGRWKGWRYFLSQEANNVATAGGLIFQLAERWRITKHPYVLDAKFVTVKDDKTHTTRREIRVEADINRAKRSKLEGGIYPQMIGQSLGLAGSSLELGINYFHEWQSHKMGYGCAASVRQVKTYKKHIDDLFTQREVLLTTGGISSGDLAVARAEGAVLRDVTTLSLREYEDFHVNARRFRAFQDSLYLWDIAKNGTGIAGNIVTLVGNHEGRPYLNGPGGVLTTVSGACAVMLPVASRGWGKVVGDWHARRLKREIYQGSACPLSQYDLDRKSLQLMIDDKRSRGEIVSERATALLATYEGNVTERARQVELAQRELRAGTRAAQENFFAGTIVGTTKISLGLCNVISGYGLTTANHRTNDLIIPGTIAYMSGLWISSVENIRLRVLDEVNRHKLGSQGLLPGQVLSARLKKLNELESNLKAAP